MLANLGLILINRSQSRLVLATLRSWNTALWWVVAGAVVLFALVPYVPFLRDLFGFSLLSPIDLLICLGAGASSLLWYEIGKLVRR